MARVLMKGNEAIAEAAVAAGCRYFFGYPITPQNELPEYLSKRMFEVGGYFVQAESEVSAINMVYGAAGAGGRVMTSSSSPGISLKQEGMSSIACAEIPAVVVNMMRGGPGIGTIQASQADYFQSTRGGGHGDYRTLTYAPASIQEACDLMVKAFDKADEYRALCLIMGDGMIGQMMEPVEIKPSAAKKFDKSWAARGRGDRKHNSIINTLYITHEELVDLNERLQAKYKVMEEKEVMVENYNMDCNPEYVLVAYGTVARICKNGIAKLKEKGINVGLVRPITVWPFPKQAVLDAAKLPGVKAMVTVEMSAGQLVEDVELSVKGTKPVELFSRLGALPPTPDEVADFVLALKGRK